VIAVDANILVYAHRADSPWFERAVTAIASLANASVPWAVPWPCVYEFLAVVTHPRVFAPPTPLGRACEQVDAWLESPSLVLLAEEHAHWPALRSVIAAGQVTGTRVHDARIAALCLQHGVSVLWTADRDFSRFPALATHNPLVA
jgi:toxin-antitoxin system PIN domain toxin